MKAAAWQGSKAYQFGLTIVVSLLGGCLFLLLHMPIPWLLGPMTAALLASKWMKLPLAWPAYARDTGIVIVGYSLGLSLTPAALAAIGLQLPTMLLMTLLLMALCTGIAYAGFRLAGIDFATMMTASVPGGLTQVITLAEEFEDIDVTVVTFFQVMRVIMIVFCVPLLIFSPWFGGGAAAEAAAQAAGHAAGWAALFPDLLLFAPVCLLCAWLGKKVHLPTAYMLGPMIAACALQLGGVHGPALPDALLNLSQFLIGCYVGLLLNPAGLKRKGRTIVFAFVSGVLLLAGSLGMSVLLARLHPVSIATGFLSMAPGGMDQMGIIAHEVGADLALVSGYQTFRILFIYFVYAAALKAILRLYVRRRAVVRTAVVHPPDSENVR